MKNLISNIKDKLFASQMTSFVATIIFITSLFSCQDENIVLPELVDNPLELSVSADNLVLYQKEATNTIDFSWTTGSNMGTGASIEYVLQIDKKGNNFSNAIVAYVGKAVYSKSYTYSEFSDSLRNRWEGIPGEETSIESRIMAITNSTDVAPDTSAIMEITVTPYLPVTSELYIVGSATEVGWDITNAIQLTPNSENSTIFTFEGKLDVGTFKFPVNRNGDWGQDMYMKDPVDSTTIYLHKGGDSDDSQWSISEAGNYLITISLLDLAFQIQKLGNTEVPPFENIYIVGDGCASGWNIDTPEPFTISESDPFIFTYEGLLTPGSIKILAGATGDWCGQWYRPLVDEESLTSTELEQNSGCDVDNKWLITAETAGYYKVTLDTRTVSIKFEKIELYLIGDAGPNGWNIGTPTPMTTSNDGVYTYSGPLTAGEFKISKFKGDWCDGDWINSANSDQAVTNGDYIITHGCDGPDNKWRVTDATVGNYDITVDLNNETISIVKQ